MTTAQKRRLIYVCVTAAIPLIALWRGFVLHKLWAWFGVPLGLPVVNVWHAYGICITFQVLGPLPKRPRVDGAEEEFSTEIEYALGAVWEILVPAISILAGLAARGLGGLP